MARSILTMSLAAGLTTSFAVAQNSSFGTDEQCGRAHLDGVEFQPRAACPKPMHPTADQDPSDWAPWTHKPYCTDENYCVFTNSLFRQSHGISIITTPERISDTNGLLDMLFTNPPKREPQPPPWKVQELPGKGFGVIATRPIKQWAIIMTDSPNVLIDSDVPNRLKRDDGVRLFDRAMNQLPNPANMLNLARSSVDHWAPVSEDVIRTNSFGLSINDDVRMVVFPKISRINHSCEPNAATRWSSSILENAIVALRDIKAGEEISISYSEFGLTHAARQQKLKSRWGFDCDCKLCSASPKAIKASDQRRERIRELRDQTLGLVNKQQYRQAVKSHLEMLDLTKKENLIAQLGEHYWVLTKLYNASGDKKNSIKYARMAVKELTKYQEGGTEMDDNLKELQHFLSQVK